MRCEAVQRFLNGFVDEQLSEADSRHIERHLALCITCRDRAARLRRIDDLLADLGTTAVPGGFTCRVLRAARRVMPAQSQGIDRVAPVPLSITRSRALDATAAAVLVLGLALGTWMARHTWRSEGTARVARGISTRSHDISSFYGAADSVETRRSLSHVYLTFVDRSESGD
jgi:anti-sigma factor RsiW